MPPAHEHRSINISKRTVMSDYREGMSYQRGVDGFHVSAVEIRVLHVVQQRVAPVKSIGGEIHGQTVRPSQRNVPEHDQIRSVRVRTAYVGRSIPFGEKYETIDRIMRFRYKSYYAPITRAYTKTGLKKKN